MKKLMLVAAIAICAMGCCKKADGKCCKEEGKCCQQEQKCCEAEAEQAVADSAVVEVPVEQVAE